MIGIIICVLLGLWLCAWLVAEHPIFTIGVALLFVSGIVLAVGF
jgi:hypothetical membrane protein